MDKLGKQLRDDADRFDVTVSAELQRRIDASLHSVGEAQLGRQSMPARSSVFWWASSLTGIAAAAAFVVFINTGSTLNQGHSEATGSPAIGVAESVPAIDWNMQPAMLTTPLEAELAALQADIKKAEQTIKSDIGL